MFWSLKTDPTVSKREVRININPAKKGGEASRRGPVKLWAHHYCIYFNLSIKEATTTRSGLLTAKGLAV